MLTVRRLVPAVALACLCTWAAPAGTPLLATSALAEEGDPPGGGDKKPADGEKPPEGEKPAAPDETEIKEFCKDYEAKLSKMVDEEAMQGIDKLQAWYVHAEVPEGAKKAILGSVGKALKLRNREAVTEKLAKALADFGEEGVGFLRYIVDTSLKQKAPPSGVVTAAFKSLGKIASPKAADVKWLTDHLKKDDDVISKAAHALAGYAGAPGAVRRDIFEELLKMSEGVFNAQNGNDPAAKRRWNIWGEDVVEAMQKLSRQNWTKPPEFRTWFNEKDPGGGKNPKTWADPEPAGK